MNSGCATIKENLPLFEHKQKVRETSRHAYYRMSPDLTRQEADVLRALRELGQASIAELACFLNWEKSTVSARLNNLKPDKKNKVVPVLDDRGNHIKRKSRYGNSNVAGEIWKLREP